MFRHCHGVDRVSKNHSLGSHIDEVVVDLKLNWNEEDRENITVPMNVYEQACVSDVNTGLEVG